MMRVKFHAKLTIEADFEIDEQYYNEGSLTKDRICEIEEENIGSLGEEYFEGDCMLGKTVEYEVTNIQFVEE